MTRKDAEALAKALAKERPFCHTDMFFRFANMIESVCAAANPEFDREQFRWTIRRLP